MPLVFGAIAPHGSQIIEQLAPTPDEAAATRAAMYTLEQRLAAHQPDTIVLLTPHGIRIEGAICLSLSHRAEGSLGPAISVAFDVDRELAGAIAEQSAAEGVPVARAIYGASAGPACSIPLDWGAVIPLWFMGHRYRPQPRVVVICPSRSLSREQMVAFGRAVGRAAEQSTRRVALIASADQAHAHQEGGPYGFDPAAPEYDRQMCEAVRTSDLLGLLQTDPDLVDGAKPDSLWQMLILAGALQVKPLTGELLAYEVPTYFGMLTAVYQ